MKIIPDDESQKHEERRPQGNQTSSLSDLPFEEIENQYNRKARRYKRFSIPSFETSTSYHKALRTEYTKRLRGMKKKGFWRSMKYHLYLRHL